jgi:amino-acid N-acetyltransferase
MSADPVEIRPATRGDAAAVTRLLTAAGLPTAGLDRAWLLLVAERPDRPGRVVGAVALERHHEPPRPPAFLLRSLVVDPVARSAGIGQQLVSAALQRADTHVGHTAAVGLLTQTADGYLPRFGFRRVGRDELPTALHASPELTVLCDATARSYLRP